MTLKIFRPWDLSEEKIVEKGERRAKIKKVVDKIEKVNEVSETKKQVSENLSDNSVDFLSGSNSLFFYPNTINELGSLTKSELAALGLLPLGPQSSLKTKRLRPKRFSCPHCNVAFSNNGQLKGHIRIHTGERPFVCEEDGCGKSFTRNEELTRHRRIHSGLRPFPCTYCGKKFGRKDHLKKHTRTHERGYHSPLLLNYSNQGFGTSEIMYGNCSSPHNPFSPLFFHPSSIYTPPPPHLFNNLTPPPHLNTTPSTTSSFSSIITTNYSINPASTSSSQIFKF